MEIQRFPDFEFRSGHVPVLRGDLLPALEREVLLMTRCFCSSGGEARASFNVWRSDRTGLLTDNAASRQLEPMRLAHVFGTLRAICNAPDLPLEGVIACSAKLQGPDYPCSEPTKPTA